MCGVDSYLNHCYTGIVLSQAQSGRFVFATACVTGFWLYAIRWLVILIPTETVLKILRVTLSCQ